MLPSLIALRHFTRVLAWVALITFAIGAIFARDLVLIQSVRSSTAAASAPPEKRIAKVRPSGISKRAAWNPTDPPDDDDETDEDSDTVAPTHARMMLPAVLTGVAPAMFDAQLARFVAREFFVPIARRHATPVRGPPNA